MAKWLFQILVLTCIAIWWAVWSVPSTQVRLIVCDVGQGDAILVMKGTYQALVDGGPNTKVLVCLAKYLPFYDRTLELVVATHADADHIGGLAEVFARYHVETWVNLPTTKQTEVYTRLNLAATQSRPLTVYAGDQLRLGNTKITFDIVWPSRQYYQEHKDKPEDSNLISIVGILSYGQTKVLLGADADSQTFPAMLTSGQLRPVDILKVPHHGSKTGLTSEWLAVLKPKLALLSVGSHNRYGHPASEVLTLLNDQQVSILRTDERGDIVVHLTPTSWRYKK